MKKTNQKKNDTKKTALREIEEKELKNVAGGAAMWGT